jgi:hypothetical protein
MSQFNEKSKRLMQNLAANIQSSGYQSRMNYYLETGTGPYGMGITQVCQIFIYNNGREANRLDFWCDDNGYPESVAIYGTGLYGHYNDIARTKNCFGFKVTDVEMDQNFVDVYLDVNFIKNL